MLKGSSSRKADDHYIRGNRLKLILTHKEVPRGPPNNVKILQNKNS